MRYAIASDGDQVAAHFGRCERYLLVDVDDGVIIRSEEIPNPGHAPGLLPRFLAQHDVDTVVAGGAGPRAVGLLAELGIEVCLGVSGSIDDVLAGIADGTLEPGQSACDH